MSVENWKALIIERLLAYDPNIDVTEGSAARLRIVEPLVRRLSPTLLENSPEIFVMARLQQEHPDLFLRDGGPFNDVLIGPMMTLFDGVKREIRDVRKSLPLSDPSTLTTSDVDARLENMFFTRDIGAYASVRARLYFSNPVSVVIGTANTAFTARSLRFIPTTPVRFTATAVLLNRDEATGYYYVDVTFRAERPGAAYNIGAGEIIGVTGLNTADVTNLGPASPGRDAQTNAEFIDAASVGIGERSLNTHAGIVAVVQQQQFPSIDILQVVGFNDVEMNRDIVRGGSLGAILHSGADASTSDDGDSDSYTNLIDFVSFDVTANLGPVGTDLSSFTVMINLPTGPQDFTLGAVTGVNQVSIASSYTDTDRLPDSGVSGALWVLRQRNVITLSDIPGGILFPSSDGETITVPDGEIHVGSCTDIYLRGQEFESKALVLSLVADQETVGRGEDGSTTLDSDIVTLTDLTATMWDAITVNRTALYLETGPAGAYRIIEKVGTSPYRVRVDQDMGSTSTPISFVLVDDIDIDLVEPKEVRWEGTDLKTVAGVSVVETVSGNPDFVAVGVTDDDILEILNGDDAGEYEIAPGGVTSSQITLLTAPSNTSSPLNFTIYREQDGIDRPLVRVTEVELLDGDLEPTGSVIPYRHPVDVQSRAFQNPGRGARAGTDIAITDDTLERLVATPDVVESSNSSLDYYSLGVRQGYILNINDTDNQGYYTVSGVGGDPNSPGLSSNQLELETELQWPLSGMEYEVGPPSYGSFRVFFFDPCTYHVTADETQFDVVINNVTRSFRPDPDMLDQFLPTAVTVPTIVFTSGNDEVTTYIPGGTALDPILHDVQVGDRVDITYSPIVGSRNVEDEGPIDVDQGTVQIDVGSGPETVVFDGTSISLDEIVSQLNAQLSREVASNWEDPSIADSGFLRLRGDHKIIVKNNTLSTDVTADIFGTNRATYNPWLTGAFAGQDTENDCPTGLRGNYLVKTVTSTQLELEESDGSAWAGPSHTITKTGLGHYIRISRPGRQRISSTDMADQQDENRLYYFDVECISVGHGDHWNIDADEQATVTGYYSEGWSVRTEDEDTSYSMAERSWIDVTPRILIVGEDYDLTRKTEITGENIQVVYERDDTVEQVHDFVRDRTNRVTCNNPLARALLPVFVRVTLSYTGGGSADDLLTDIQALIRAVPPDNELQVSDIEALLTRSGATYIRHPITLIGVAHQLDRSIYVERSQDAISSSRLFGLLADSDSDGDLVILDRQPS